MNAAPLAAAPAHLAAAQAGMRAADWHGAFGVPCSALTRAAAAGVAAWGPQQAVWPLLIGGMFIVPASRVLAKLAGRRVLHDHAHPLGRRVIEAFLVGLPLWQGRTTARA